MCVANRHRKDNYRKLHKHFLAIFAVAGRKILLFFSLGDFRIIQILSE